MISTIRITWDAAPIRQQFGDGLLVVDGVATLPNGTQYRVNASANRHGKRADVMLRYLTAAKRGHAVPETVCAAVRDAARIAASETFAAMIADERAARRPADERADIDNMAGAPEPRTIKLRGFGVRKDNVEYHNGRDAYRANETKGSNPYLAGGERAARWDLGWQDACDSAVPIEVIDMTPTWGAIVPVLLAAMEHGTDKGRDAARVELTRMAELADKYVSLQTALKGR